MKKKQIKIEKLFKQVSYQSQILKCQVMLQFTNKMFSYHNVSQMFRITLKNILLYILLFHSL